jgi:probable O-glycosylation ligase (exosortase A-associated)
MRSLIVLAIFAFLLAFALVRPQVGLMTWAWLTLMQPHQQTWGLEQFRLNLVVAVVALGVWLVSKEPKKPVSGLTTLFIIMFMISMIISQTFSLKPEYSFVYFDRFMRVMIFVLLCAIVITTKVRIHALVWILCISIGFYAVKAGLFTIATGGSYRTFGPEATVINDNNHFAAAIIFILPLLNYLRMQSASSWLRIGLIGTTVLSFVAVLGSHSRGALIGLLAIGLPLWWRSRNRVLLLLVAVPLVVGALHFMPEEWWQRMNTIESAGEKDESFLGRVDSWVIHTAIAMHRPLTGGGFRVGYLQDIADRYTSEGLRSARAAHSIYFEILGSLGFLGLLLFLAILAMGFVNGFWIIRRVQGHPELEWADHLSRMAQVSLFGYCVTGAAVSIEFWEGSWLIVVVLARIRWALTYEVGLAPASARRTGQSSTLGKSERIPLRRRGV